MDSLLDKPIKYLPGIGERRAEALAAEIGVQTFGDLLMHIPFRYIDRSKVYKIAEIDETLSTQYVQVRARVREKGVVGVGAKARLALVVADDTGRMDLVWFRGARFVMSKLEIGREYIFFGRPTMFNGFPNMAHPEFEPPVVVEGQEPVRMQGIYSTTERLTSMGLGTKAIFQAMRTLWGMVRNAVLETLPAYLIEREGLAGRAQALHDIHFPASAAALQAALRRLKFEELFLIQLQLLGQRRVRTEKTPGYPMPKIGGYFNLFYRERLPFALTGAQQRVVKEIRGDMVSGHQMNRLMQGDVGSGKTIVALLCVLIAADNGFQSAIMAPTEILAAQHYRSIAELVDTTGLRVELLTGSTRKRKREEIAEGLLSGEIDLLIGTHALIEEGVRFGRLGFVVIDEQHRFGVMQRAKLRLKSQELPPHVLVMTATPIPRTLAMTLYGDLDVSVIDELPPGRKPIHTSHARESHRLRLFGFLREQIAQGRQVYIVYPLIQESETLDVANLEAGAEVVAREFPPPQYTSVVVHGKMPAKLKDYGMELFKSGQAQILISTTVIEVGVDVPNATVMVIESAERFGLSQLHQLRGRVGRGGEQSYCILMTGDKLTTEARHRMEAMVSTTDGFRLSELDLQLRGAGDIDGTAQSGQGFEIKVANLAKDGDILEYARGVAEGILAEDPQLQRPENSLLVEALERLNRNKQAEVDLSQIS
ncbi:MAG: ATP-dependent DNA helicase RecG [Rikenella sp.]|nr:ATP-dependent DNA helicase RecG [Rikenella sp.]